MELYRARAIDSAAAIDFRLNGRLALVDSKSAIFTEKSINVTFPRHRTSFPVARSARCHYSRYAVIAVKPDLEFFFQFARSPQTAGQKLKKGSFALK